VSKILGTTQQNLKVTKDSYTQKPRHYEMSAGKTFPSILHTKTTRDPQFVKLGSKRTAAELSVSKGMLMEETL
jgi:hypothetical protein